MKINVFLMLIALEMDNTNEIVEEVLSNNKKR